MSQNTALRDFLRARRADVSPARAGLAGTGGRRVPGLRREEVAALAGVSVDYYMRLEQGRDISPSDSVLDSVSRALRLSPAQRSHLYLLVRGRRGDAPEQAPAADLDVDGLLRALAVPAIVAGRGTEIIASNALYRALTTGFDTRPADHRFYAHWLFLDPAAPAVLATWDRSARETVGVLRAAVTRYPEDRRIRLLVDELHRGSQEFRELWAEHDVAVPAAGPKGYRHPVVGELLLHHQVARMSEDTWLHLYWAEPGTAAEEALQRLHDVVARGPVTPAGATTTSPAPTG